MRGPVSLNTLFESIGSMITSHTNTAAPAADGLECERNPSKRPKGRSKNGLEFGSRPKTSSLNKSQTFSWRIGAYRQRPTLPTEPVRDKHGTKGMLVLQEQEVGRVPQPPMTWMSPLNETSDEGALFHYYGANIPSIVYGVRQNGLWCPVRAMSMPCGFMYTSQFRWMLIMSETHQAARRGVSPPMSLFKRKAAAYQQLNAALADPVQKYSFETILSVNAALFVEARIVGPEITRMHLKALDQLYVARNRRFAEDNDSFATLLRLSIYTAWLMCECEAPNQLHLQDTVSASLDKLQSIEDWVVKTRKYWKTGSTDVADCKESEKFRQAKKRLLEHHAVKPLIAQPPFYMSYTHIASLFSVLLLLNLSIYELGQDIGCFFLDRLTVIIDNSMDRDRSGKSLLKLPALPMMMAQARLDVLHTYTRHELGLADDVVDESLETRNVMIDALKMFSYLGEDKRRQLIQTLFAWLVDESSLNMLLSGDAVDNMRAEIISNWTVQELSRTTCLTYQRQPQRKASPTSCKPE